MSFRAAVRYANRSLQTVALLAIGTLAIMTAMTVFDGDDRLRSAVEALAHEGAHLESERPVRRPLGEPLVGDAVDDYTWRCNHQHPDEQPTSRAKLAALSSEQRAALDTPAERAVIDRFARGQFREDVSAGAPFVECGLALIKRPKAVLAGALVAADRGDLEVAWRRAVALVRYADDMLGRASIVTAMVANVYATAAVSVLADLAERGTPEQLARWRSEIVALQASAIGPELVDRALAVGEGGAILSFDVDDETLDEVTALMEAYERTTRGDKPDISVLCESVRDRDLPAAICDMRLDINNNVTVIAAGLDAVECKLAGELDPSCATTASRL